MYNINYLLKITASTLCLIFILTLFSVFVNKKCLFFLFFVVFSLNFILFTNQAKYDMIEKKTKGYIIRKAVYINEETEKYSDPAFYCGTDFWLMV